MDPNSVSIITTFVQKSYLIFKPQVTMEMKSWETVVTTATSNLDGTAQGNLPFVITRAEMDF